jgi:hypothetical protein
MSSSCAVSGSVTMPWQVNGNRRCSAPLISALKRPVTSRPALLGVSAQIHGMGVPASDPQSHHSHHNLGGVAEIVVTAASATCRTYLG